MNNKKFTDESDFYLQMDALSCGHNIFIFQITEKKIKHWNPCLPPPLTFFSYIFPRKLNLFLKLSIKKLNGTSTLSAIQIYFLIEWIFQFFFFKLHHRNSYLSIFGSFKHYFQREIYVQESSLTCMSLGANTSQRVAFYFQGQLLFSLKMILRMGNIGR